MRTSHEVCVVGGNRSYNELLAAAIERELSFAGSTSPEMPPLAGIFEVWEISPTILLVDETDESARTHLGALLAEGDLERPPVAAALFNVGRASAELRDAVRRGLKGIFFSTDTLAHLLNGIKSIAGGEVWIPREILVGAATDTGQRARIAVEQAGLTMREVEILTHIASGATNEQVASTLFVSPHTVKTHVYNIFRKIGVKNRLCATLWAAEYLRRWPAALPASVPPAANANELAFPQRSQAVI